MVFKRNAFRRTKREARQNKRRMLVSGAVACVVLVVAVGIWYGARRPAVTIHAVTVSGGTTVPHEVIEKKVESTLSGSYALLIPRRFSYGFPRDEIVEAINSIPRVHGASVVRASRNELAVTFEEYEPYALWCDSVPTGSTTPSCVFVDETGFAYAPAPSLNGESMMRFVVEGRMPESGVNVYDAETVRRYRMLSDAIAERHSHRLRLITETKDGDLILHLNNSTNILMAKDSDIEDVFAHIESVFQTEEFKDVALENLEYIDVRFGNKVYVKERGVAIEPEPALATGEGEASVATGLQDESMSSVLAEEPVEDETAQ